MVHGPGSMLRKTAATLMCLSGTAQFASLWLRELTGTALIDGLWGTVYLIIGIGLFGHSRFSVVMGIVVPATAAGVLIYNLPNPELAYTLRIAIDAVVALVCAVVLWESRHHPSV
ncbi:Uncharacterised protein [Halioglobus japonicus]|nr:Uncharacterised protein [Halioglobus japonicus]